MHARLTPTAAAIALLMAHGSLLAQSAPAKKAEDKAEKLEAVIVTGIRASLQASITQKKKAESLVEVITAEDVGKMPDKNVADSLQRVPGLSTTSAGSAEGSFGENEHVQMRGLHSQYTQTLLNGHLVSTGDWYGPNIAASGRSVTFTLLPSDLIGRVVVNKSSQADLVEGGAAGTINIETRHPLDFKESLYGVASLEVARSAAAKKNDPSATALLAWHNADKTFGILGQVFSQGRHLQRAGSEGVWWDKTGATYPVASLAGKNISLLSGAVLFEQERERKGGYLEVDFRPSKDVSLNLSAFASKMDAKNFNTNYMADLINVVYGPGWNGKAVAPTGPTSLSGDTITSIFAGANAFAGVGGSAGAWSVVEDVAARPDAKTDSKFLNLDGKWRVSDSLTLTTKLGSTSGGGSTTDVGFEVLSAWNQGAGYTLSPEGIFVLDVPGGDKFKPAGGGIGGWGGRSSSKDSERYGQVDAEMSLDDDFFHTLKFGARLAKHRRELTRLGMTLKAGADNEAQIPASAIGNYPANWYGSLPVNPTPGFLPFKISKEYVAQWVAQYATFTNHATQAEFDIQEDTSAGYVMSSFGDNSGLAGNVGLRAVRTDATIKAYLPGGKPSFDNAYTDLLPSLNLRKALGTDLVARFALHRSMARPDFGQLAGNDLRDIQHEGVAGNPMLKSIKANNIDGALEWYFAPKSALTVGAFASNLDGAITYSKETRLYANASKPGSPVEAYKVSTPVNGKGRMTGLELQAQVALGSGFGIDANYTRSNGRQTQRLADSTCNGTATEECSLYGTSKDVYNAGAYYENDWMSARLAYSHRSAYKLGNRGGADYFQSANGQLNFALNVNPMKNLTVTFEAQNLADPLLTVYKTDLTQIAGVYKAGKMYFAGLRYKL
ncbi:TonB-dependent receptor [Inhella gelatinilytica]|uniref:TonB-dependent receptor n=1 Tax=Inhella gelatinilytica TaxID=2795030 RepID=A0A931IWZ3_9BURK|nr:TonB-dependent receptor [Inhella gelatinilytica]MBH9552178.1 TonB-dependent receptor [Inhella gelatinilytica]